MNKLAELDALYEAATPGEWEEWHGDDEWCMNCIGITVGDCTHEFVNEEGHEAHTIALTLLQQPRLISVGDQGDKPDMDTWRWHENAALIAALHNSYPALRTVIEAAEKCLRFLEVRHELERVTNGCICNGDFICNIWDQILKLRAALEGEMS